MCRSGLRLVLLGGAALTSNDAPVASRREPAVVCNVSGKFPKYPNHETVESYCSDVTGSCWNSSQPGVPRVSRAGAGAVAAQHPRKGRVRAHVIAQDDQRRRRDVAAGAAAAGTDPWEYGWRRTRGIEQQQRLRRQLYSAEALGCSVHGGSVRIHGGRQRRFRFGGHIRRARWRLRDATAGARVLLGRFQRRPRQQQPVGKQFFRGRRQVPHAARVAPFLTCISRTLQSSPDTAV